MKKSHRLIFAFVCAAIGAAAAWFFVSNKDDIFQWNWATPVGRFEAGKDEGLLDAARAFSESKLPGKACVGQWIGKDERYAYIGMGCAQFREHLGEIRMDGDQGFMPVRYSISEGKVTGMEQPAASSFANSLKRIYPREAAALWKAQLSVLDFQRRGLMRMQEKGFSTIAE